MKNVPSSSGKVVFIVLIAVIVVILLAAGAGWYFQKAAVRRPPDPQPAVTRHRIPSAPVPPEEEVVVAQPKIPISATQTAPPEEMGADISAGVEAQVKTPEAEQTKPDVLPEGDQAAIQASDAQTPETDQSESAVQPKEIQTATQAHAGVAADPSRNAERDAKRSEAPPVVDARSSEKKAWYAVQVGAFRSKENADRSVAALQKKGYEAFITESGDAGSQTLYFVRFGRYVSKTQAQAALAEFKQKEKKPAFIMRSDQ